MTKSKVEQARAGERVANGGAGYYDSDIAHRIDDAFATGKNVQQVADEFCVSRKYLWKLHGAAIRAMIRMGRPPFPAAGNHATMALSATASGLATVARQRKAKP